MRSAGGHVASGSMDWAVPTLADVLDARDRISAYLRPTPLYRYPAIDQRLTRHQPGE